MTPFLGIMSCNSIPESRKKTTMRIFGGDSLMLRILTVLILVWGHATGDLTQEILVDEGTTPGTLIGSISGSPNKEIPTPPYIIMAYQDTVDRDLSINENTGEIRAKVTLDREVTDFYSFMAVPLMGGSNIRVKITVQDINDHAPTFKTALVNIEFSESQPRDTRRSLPPASDQDVGINTTQRYEIISGNINQVFRLSSRRGRDGSLYLDLEINGVLDRENIENYLLVIEAYDGGNAPRTGRLTVNVTLLDDNDNQPLFSESRYYASVMENATIGTFLLQVTATDTDLGKNGQISYWINRRLGDAEHNFIVHPRSGVVTLNKALNYEERSAYELVITARDNGTQTLESSTFVYVDVINVNDQPPKIDIVFLNNAKGVILESTPVGEFVARISVSDEDAFSESKILLTMTGGMEKFDLVSETSSIFMLRVKNGLDYEEQNNFTVSLLGSDGGQPPLMTEKSITIFLEDVNDNAPVFEKTVYNVEMSEGVENGSILFHVSAVDMDSGDNALVEYFVPTEKNSGKIWMDGKSGMVFSAVTWEDCQEEESIDIVIGARDHGKPVLSSTAVLRMVFRSDSDAAPVFEKSFYNISLEAEDVLVGNCFLKLHANGTGCSGSGKIHYTFHASWTDDYFRINSETGEICILRSLDHVHSPVRQFVVQASNYKGNANATAVVQVSLPPISIFKSQYFIMDTFHAAIHNIAPIGSPVVQVRPDPDVSEDTFGLNFIYTIESGNDHLLFQMEPVSGLIHVGKSLQNHVGEHKLLLNVHEISSKIPLAQLQVLVKVAARVPYFTSKLYKFIIAEDASISSTVGILQTLPQYSGSLKFSMGSPASSFFEVEPGSGLVRTASFLDREMQRFHMLSVVAQDGHGDQDSCQVMISVSDVDDNVPTFPSTQVDLHVPESAPAGDVIFQAIAFDRDSLHRKPLRYSAISDRTDHFHLDAVSGILTINKPLDYENTSLHEITVEAAETLVPTSNRATIRVRIHVLDRNDHSPVFERSSYEVKVKEGSAVDVPILKITATDGDTGKNGRISYYIDSSSNIDHLFKVHADTGEVFLRQPLDREKQDVFTFWVQAVDHGRPPVYAITTVMVYVLDENDCSPIFTEERYNFTLAENTVAGVLIGKIQAKDSDLDNNSKIVYGWNCNDSFFDIDGESGEVYSKRPLDREETPIYTCSAFATDGGDPPRKTTVSVMVSVTDVNDHSPVIVVPVDEVVWVTEGEPEGTEILKVIAKDADEGENGRITFSLDLDEDSRAFSIHPSQGTIRSQIILDHEKQTFFRITVTATDRGTPALSTKKSITINVADVNDHRPTFSSNVMTIEVTEGTSAGVEIGSVLATDADSGENGRISYQIIRGNLFGAFEVGRTSGKLYTAREVDYELAPSYMLRVRAVDNSSLKPKSNLLVVNVLIIDINDSSPKFTTETCLFSIPENIPIGSNVWNFSAVDADSGSFGQILYEIPYQFPNLAFRIHPTSGALTVGEKIDYERHKEYTFVVTALDRDPEKTRRKNASLKCHVLVEDENDYAPKFVSRNQVRISERVEDGYPVTQMVALDEDSFKNGKVTYEILRGNEEKLFALDGESGMISINKTTPHLKTKSYSLTIAATDNGTPRLATMHTLTIQIDSVGSKISVFNQSLYEIHVKEDNDVGTLVLMFPDVQPWNGTVRFNVPEEFLYEKFAVDSQTGEIRVAKVMDREKKDLYTMNIYATSKQNALHYDFATIVIEITDVNDNAPSFQDTCQGLSISENNEFGPVHKFVATDADLGENGRISYRIESGNLEQKFFINPQDGELAAKTLDREEQDEHTLLIVAEDHGRPSKQTICRMKIAVLDRNDNSPAFTTAAYSVHVAEDVPTGHNVIQVRAFDKDLGENARVSYSLGNDTRGIFTINENTGLLTTVKNLDHEDLPKYLVEVVASDNSRSRAQTAKVVVEVFIDDVNDNEPEFSKFLYELKVPEPVYYGQKVAQVVAKDKDSGQNSDLIYSFAAPQPKFNIDPSTGSVTAKQNLGKGGASVYRMAVVAKDRGKEVQRSSVGMLDIMVGDAPASASTVKFISSSYSASIPENSRIGTTILTVKARLTGGKEEKILYSIADGNSAGVFDINKRSGLITIRDNTALDYERYRAFNLTLLAESDDGERLQSYAKLTVKVSDENDNAPHFSQNKYSSSVYEGDNKGIFVTQLFASDADSGMNSLLSYEIVDGNYDGAFVIDPPFSGIVKTNVVLDREVHHVYRLSIVARDSGKPQKTGSCTLKITIVDINDNDPVFPHYDSIFVSEGVAVGSVIFTVAANDVDAAHQKLTYSMNSTGNGNGTFSINKFSGKIILAAPLDREKTSFYLLTIRAFDEVHHAITNLTVIIKDENDNHPLFSESEYKVIVPEMTPSNTPVLTVSAKDVDEGDNAKIRYSVKLAPVEGFTVDERSGVVRTTKEIIFDPMHPLIHLIIQAEDQGSPKLSAIAAVQIQVTSINRNAPVFTQTVYLVHISEDSSLGQEILQVSAHDPDAERGTASVTYTLSGDTEKNFQLDSQNGKLIALKRLDRETTATYSLRAVASDKETPVRNNTAEVIIYVDDVNDFVPQFNQTEYKAFISESVKTGEKVLQVSAVDFDSGENATISYAIISGNDDKLFRINSATGTVEVAGALDYDNTSDYKLLIEARDGGRRPQSSVVVATVYLQDANDNAPFFPVNHYKESIPENSPAGTYIFTARAHDRDRGIHGKLRYSISGGDGATEFDIDPTNGKITTRNILDYEAKQVCNFVVTATDTGGSRADVQVTVNIDSRDEFDPKFGQQHYRFFISPESKKGEFVGQVSASDQDAGLDGRIIYSFQRPSDIFVINNATGVITLLLDLHIDNSSTDSTASGSIRRKRSVTPEDSSLITASSGRKDSRTGVALVTVVFGAPDFDSTTGSFQSTLLPGIVAGVVVLLLIISVAVVFFIRKKYVKNRRAPYSDSFDVLQYSTFHGRENGGRAADGTNHYHDPTVATIAAGSEVSSSGRGSVDDHEIRGILGSQYYVATGQKKVKTFFPKMMPDSGLPDCSDYSQKLPIPPSSIGSNESSVHHFDIEGGYEADGRDVFLCTSDPERSSGGSSSHNHPSRYPRGMEFDFEAEMAANNNFDYLKWVPEYAPMAAVYAEIAEIAEYHTGKSPSSLFQGYRREDLQQNSSSSPSITFSKSSSQTTLPSNFPIYDHGNGRYRGGDLQREGTSQTPRNAGHMQYRS